MTQRKIHKSVWSLSNPKSGSDEGKASEAETQACLFGPVKTQRSMQTQSAPFRDSHMWKCPGLRTAFFGWSSASVDWLIPLFVQAGLKCVWICFHCMNSSVCLMSGRDWNSVTMQYGAECIMGHSMTLATTHRLTTFIDFTQHVISDIHTPTCKAPGWWCHKPVLCPIGPGWCRRPGLSQSPWDGTHYHQGLRGQRHPLEPAENYTLVRALPSLETELRVHQEEREEREKERAGGEGERALEWQR